MKLLIVYCILFATLSPHLLAQEDNPPTPNIPQQSDVLHATTLNHQTGCPLIKCDKVPSFDQTENTCFKRHSSTQNMTFTPCPGSSKCLLPFSLLESDINKLPDHDVQCEQVQTSQGLDLGFPGDSCTTNEECLNNDCDTENTQKCTGAKEGESCNWSFSCQAGLFCERSSKTCKKQAEIGSSCHRTDGCVNNAFCYDGTCTAYLTLPNGAAPYSKQIVALHPSQRMNFLCESMYTDDKGNCAKAPKSANDYALTTCGNNTDCILTDGEVSTCDCGFNPEGKRYCARAIGDPIFEKVREEFKKIVEKNGKCHTRGRFNRNCGDIEDLVTKFDTLVAFALYGHKAIGAPLCLPEMFQTFEGMSLYKQVPTWDETVRTKDHIDETGQQKMNVSITSEGEGNTDRTNHSTHQPGQITNEGEGNTERTNHTTHEAGPITNEGEGNTDRTNHTTHQPGQITNEGEGNTERTNHTTHQPGQITNEGEGNTDRTNHTTHQPGQITNEGEGNTDRTNHSTHEPGPITSEGEGNTERTNHSTHEPGQITSEGEGNTDRTNHSTHQPGQITNEGEGNTDRTNHSTHQPGQITNEGEGNTERTNHSTHEPGQITNEGEGNTERTNHTTHQPGQITNEGEGNTERTNHSTGPGPIKSENEGNNDRTNHSWIHGSNENFENATTSSVNNLMGKVDAFFGSRTVALFAVGGILFLVFLVCYFACKKIMKPAEPMLNINDTSKLDSSPSEKKQKKIEKLGLVRPHGAQIMVEEAPPVDDFQYAPAQKGEFGDLE